ncbi:hypothetical protein [Psychrobacter sp. MES7-P7E]|uniref:hypothetical protein n=1 Tax=Psychrobacter sp. MES7-P7E TaxID=2058322 RepID=UPI000C7F1C25|nr:hypothetical protein [Psychrobacter sp. MES7-P7E]PLT21119.1 hypothetical protein CXF62_11490 [Psychrobacter sp. MES7-P7E]
MSIEVKKTKSGLVLTKTNQEPSNPKGWQDRYDINCPYCLEGFDCAPSIFHMMGAYELGGGSCPSCKEMMEIHFHPETNSMTTHKAVRESVH